MANGTTTHATSTATKTIATTPVAKTTTAIGPSANILSQDTFQRADQRFWGTASDGQTWTGDAANAPAFAIVNHAGQVGNGSGIYDALLGPRAADTQIVFSGSVSHFGESNMGALLRWTDANNLYKVFFDGTNLTVLRKVAGVVSILQSVPFPAQDGQSYTLRVRMVGSSISARVWQTGQTEPSTWMLNATDTMLPSGYDGMRLIVASRWALSCDQHGKPQHRNGAEITRFLEVEDQHRDHLGLRREQDNGSGKFAHDADEDEAPGRDHARAQQRRRDVA